MSSSLFHDVGERNRGDWAAQGRGGRWWDVMMDLDGVTDNTDDRGTHNLFRGAATVALANVDLPFYPVNKLAAIS